MVGEHWQVGWQNAGRQMVMIMTREAKEKQSDVIELVNGNGLVKLKNKRYELVNTEMERNRMK